MVLTVAKIDALRERRENLVRERADYLETFGERDQMPAFARRDLDMINAEIELIDADIGDGY